MKLNHNEIHVLCNKIFYIIFFFDILITEKNIANNVLQLNAEHRVYACFGSKHDINIFNFKGQTINISVILIIQSTEYILDGCFDNFTILVLLIL